MLLFASKPSVHLGFISQSVLWCERSRLYTGIFVSYLPFCTFCVLISLLLPLSLFSLLTLFFLVSHLLTSKWLELKLCLLSVQPPSQAEKQRLEEALNAAQEEEGSLAAAKRALEVRLDEAQRGLARMGQEQQALNRALEEEAKQREALRRGKAELEEQKRLLDRTVDRLNKEVGHGVAWAQEEAPLVQKLALGDGVDVGQNMCCLLSSSTLLGRPRSNLQRVASFLPPRSAASLPPISYSLMVWILGNIFWNSPLEIDKT